MRPGDWAPKTLPKHRVVVLKDRRKTSYVVRLGWPTFENRGREHHSGQGNLDVVEVRDEPLIRDLWDEGLDRMSLAGFTVVNTTQQGAGFLTYRFSTPNTFEDARSQSFTARTGGQIVTLCRCVGNRRTPVPPEMTRTLRDGATKGTKQAHYELLLNLADIETLTKLQTSFATEIRLDLRTYPDGDRAEIEETISLRVEFGIRRHYGKRLVAVDFGTSAVAAGFHADDYHDINLQQVYVKGGTQREDNLEHGTSFIPSVAMAATRVFADRAGDDLVDLGAPEFLKLPAATQAISVNPEHAILALKSCIGSGKSKLVIPGDKLLRYRNEDGHEVKAHTVPIWSLVQSAYAIIDRDFLKPALQTRGRAGRISQLAVTHPNTYTLLQQSKLREVAHRVFSDVHPKDLHLVSESDAAAFYYLTELRTSRAAGAPPREVALVYDIGAGTLDLSLIEMHWPPGTPNPQRIEVLGRCGIGLAGNKLDELIARVVNRQLQELAKAHTNVQYEPFVSSKVNAGWDDPENRAALVTLKQGIQELKKKLRAGATTQVRLWRDRIKSDVFTVKDPSLIPGKPLQRRDGYWWLEVPHAEVLRDGDITGFISFITHEVVTEFVASSGRELGDVNYLFISGRTSQWPGFREDVRRVFKDHDVVCPPLLKPVQLKSAVVQGAVRMFRFGTATRIEDANISGTYGLEYVDPISGQRKIDALFPSDRREWDRHEVETGSVTRTVLKPRGEGSIDCAASSWVRLVCSFAGRLDAAFQGWHRHLVVHASEQKPLDNLFVGVKVEQRQCHYIAEVDEHSRLSVQLIADKTGQKIYFDGLGVSAHSSHEQPWPIGKATLPHEVSE